MKNPTLFKSLFLVSIVVLAVSCNKKEPVETGNYFIDNETDFMLTLEADNTPIDDVVAPNSTVKFYTIEVGTGGSAAPYTIFNQFEVKATINGVETILYEGDYPTDSEDWVVKNSTNSVTEYHLTISR